MQDSGRTLTPENPPYPFTVNQNYLPQRFGNVEGLDMKKHPDAPWCWNIYLHDWAIYAVDVDKCSSTMDHEYLEHVYVYIYIYVYVYVYHIHMYIYI